MKKEGRETGIWRSEIHRSEFTGPRDPRAKGRIARAAVIVCSLLREAFERRGGGNERACHMTRINVTAGMLEVAEAAGFRRQRGQNTQKQKMLKKGKTKPLCL
jgi:hypothetical protein